MKKSLLLTLLLAFLLPWALQAEILTFDFEDGQIPAGWTTDATYPWISATEDPDQTPINCIKSSNSGVGSSSSTISATFTFAGNGSISFRGGCWGEGTSSAWDKCIFSIDGSSKFANGALQSWNEYSYNLEAGEHTFTWTFSKDGSVNAAGDAFYIDDVVVDLGVASACPKPTGLNIEASGVNATLSWTSDASAFSIVHATEVSANPESLSAQSSTDNSLLFEDLALGDHYFWVKADCGADGASGWAGPATVHVGYCQPAPTSVDGNGITAISFGSGDNVVNNSGTKLPASAPFYGDYSAQIGAVAASLTATVDITFSTGYTYGTIIWVDWNKSLSFEDNEIVYAGESSKDNPTTLNATFDIPASQALGDYRMRIAAADSYYDSHKTLATAAGAEPCPTGSYTVVHDYTLRVLEAPSCMPVSGLSASNIQAHSAVLDWTANGSEASWKLFVKKAADADFGEAIPVESKPYTLNELNPATTYQFKVVAVCSDTEESEPSAVASFTTECEALTIDAEHPYSENFDSYAMESAYTPSAQTLPICWSSINTTTYSSYQVYPTIYYYSYTDYSHSSPNSLRFYSSYSSYSSSDPQDQYAILPEMNDISGLRIKLYARKYSSSYEGTFYVGVMSDPADASTFEQIGEALAPASGEYELFTIPFSDYAGGGQYIAIKMEAADSKVTSRYLYIDDIVVEPIPDCLEPAGLAVAEGDDAISTNSVLLQISEGESSESAWKLQYKKHADEEWITLSDAVTENPFELAGLEAASAYDIRIAAWCDPSNAEAVSGYLDPISVATACEDIISFPWGEDFNSLTAGIPVCWDNAEGTTTNESYKWNYYASGRDGAGLRFNSYNNSNGLTNFLKTPVLSLPSDKAMLLTFMYKNPTGGDFSVLVSTDGGASYAETPLASGLTSQSSWAEKECDLSAYAGQNVVIAFKGTSNYGSGDAYIYLDDVKVDEAPTCAKPSGLSYTYSSRTAHSVELYWTNGAEGQIAWDIAYSTVSTFSPEDGEETTHIVPADANPFVLTGLDQSTTYYAYVRANCGAQDGVSAWSTAKATFSTISGHQLLSSLALVDGSLGSTSAKVNWKSNAANERHSSYEVYISQQNTLPATEEELSSDGLILNIEDTFYVFNNLEPETQYYVWVRDNCGEDGLSDWSSRATFTTTANCPVPAELSVSNVAARTADIAWNIGEAESYSVRYRVAEGMDGMEEGFENGIGQWTMVGAHNSTGVYSTAHSGAKGFRFYYRSNPPQYLISPEFGATSEDASLSFYYKAHSSSYTETFKVGYSSTNNAIESFSFGEELSTNDTEWQLFSEQVPVGTKYICIQYTADDQYYLYIDDITIGSVIPAGEWSSVAAESGERLAHLSGLAPETKYEVQVQASCGEEFSESIFFTTTPSCLPISALTLANVDAHVASFTWTASASAETQWQFAYVAKDAVPVWIDENIVNEASASVSGLTANTSYDFYVRAYCAADDQSEAIKLSFTTECAAITITASSQYMEDFEGPVVTTTFSQAGEMPGCWEGYPATSSGPKILANGASYNYAESGQVLYFYGSGNNYAVLPEFSNPLKDLQISFKWATESNSNGTLTLGYITTEDDGSYSTFAPIREFAASAGSYHKLVQTEPICLVSLPINAARLVFRWYVDNQWGCNVDDLVVGLIEPYQLNINASRFATFYDEYVAYTMPEGLTAHTFSVDNQLSDAVYSHNDVLPANVPVVMQGDAGIYSLVPTAEVGIAPIGENHLIGVNEATTIADEDGYKFYVLSLNQAGEYESVGFYWMNENGAGGFDMPAHKAYLKISDAAGAAPRFYIFNGEQNATGLDNLEGVEGTLKFLHEGNIYILRDGIIYDATGRKVRELK